MLLLLLLLAGAAADCGRGLRQLALGGGKEAARVASKERAHESRLVGGGRLMAGATAGPAKVLA